MNAELKRKIEEIATNQAIMKGGAIEGIAYSDVKFGATEMAELLGPIVELAQCDRDILITNGFTIRNEHSKECRKCKLMKAAGLGGSG